jgi:hypothetical protein
MAPLVRNTIAVTIAATIKIRAMRDMIPPKFGLIRILLRFFLVFLLAGAGFAAGVAGAAVVAVVGLETLSILV